jgi:hypothetical protein
LFSSVNHPSHALRSIRLASSRAHCSRCFARQGAAEAIVQTEGSWEKNRGQLQLQPAQAEELA